MKFTIAPGLFIRMLELVGEARPSVASGRSSPGTGRKAAYGRRCAVNSLVRGRVGRTPSARLLLARRTGPRSQEEFCLSARGDRLSVETSRTAAEIETAVWEDGTCTLSYPRFLAALHAHREQACLTIEVSAAGLRIGTTRLPVLNYSPAPRISASSQIFLATDFGVVSSPTATGNQLLLANDW